jgi:hypothetical protein
MVRLQNVKIETDCLQLASGNQWQEKETCLIKEAKEKNKANQVNALASGT